MPGGNGTGPQGSGPLTGRGAGYCAGYTMPGYANAGFGIGRRLGIGRGFGRGRGAYRMFRGFGTGRRSWPAARGTGRMRWF